MEHDLPVGSLCKSIRYPEWVNSGVARAALGMIAQTA